MDNFQYVLAKSLDEVPQMLVKQGLKAKIMSGGTDLIPQLRENRATADLIIDVKGIDEMNEIRFDKSTGLFIGAAVSCLRASNDSNIRQYYPGLVDAITLIGGVQIQGRASIGGNLCNASPAADSIPSLIVHQAICVIFGKSGKREVKVEDFCTNPGKTVMTEDEFLIGIKLPSPENGFGASYQRFIPRNEMDIAVVGVGVGLRIEPKTNKIISARIALGAVAATPLLAEAAGTSLIGLTFDDPSIDQKITEAADLAEKISRPISDMRGSADQRRHLVKVLTRREIRNAIERAKKSKEVL